MHDRSAARGLRPFGAAENAAPVKILLVDDVEQNIIALEALLGRPGIEPLRASSGSEALELLLEHEVALALIDVQMPEMDGFELAEFMRGSPRTRQVPIIFLTATDRNALRTFRGYEAGAVDFLYKPFDPHILRSKVEVFVQLQQQKAQLAEQLEAMRQLVRINEMFVAVLGHDLRNPLSAIMASAEVMLRLNDEPRVMAACERIRNSGRRMASMIDQLLDIARMRAGKLGLEPSAGDLALVCRGIVEEFEAPGSSERPSRIDFSCSGETTGQWDLDRISQVLSNLIGNALNHGTRDQAVRVSVEGMLDDALRVEVSNGGEIAPDMREHLFKPFYTSERGGSGLGLGLYIAHEIIRAHGGQLRLQSSERAGTTFEIVLPRYSRGENVGAAA